MDILRVAGQVYPEAPGGGAYHVHAMSRDQAAQGHDVTVLTISEKSPAEETRDGYKILRMKPSIEVFRNELSFDLARKLRNTNEFDIIHAHSHLRFSTNLAALTRRFGNASIPLTVTNHGLYSQSVPYWFSRVYLKTLGRWTFNAADLVFTYTPEEREILKQIGVRSDINVVSNGIDHSRFTPNGSTYEEIDLSTPSVLFVGRLFEGKRPHDVIDAIAEVVARYPEITLYLCGDGTLREELQARVNRLDLCENVVFLGHLQYEQMPSVFRAVDLLVLPSKTEGFPRVVMESLSTETPVITTNIPQLSSLVEQAGRTFAVGDVMTLAAYITGLLADREERIELGRMGRKLIKQEYSWGDTVENTTEAMRSIVQEHEREQ